MEKLRSIAKRTHWSLVAKAVLLTLLWYLPVPGVFFALAVVYFYLVPLFDAATFIFPFLAFLAGALAIRGDFYGSLPAALLTGLLFFLILGIKDLILIERRRAYGFFAFLIFLLFTILLAARLHTWGNALVFFWSLLLALLFFSLLNSFYRYAHPGRGRWERLTVFGIAALLFWEGSWVAFFLPVPSFSVMVLLMLFAVVLGDGAIQYLLRTLHRERLLSLLATLLVPLLVILVSTRWEL